MQNVEASEDVSLFDFVGVYVEDGSNRMLYDGLGYFTILTGKSRQPASGILV